MRNLNLYCDRAAGLPQRLVSVLLVYRALRSKKGDRLSEILIFARFRKCFEKYLFLKTFYPGTQYESNSARRAVSAKSSLREQLGEGARRRPAVLAAGVRQ